jgi:SAM-dependent methyltransferase
MHKIDYDHELNRNYHTVEGAQHMLSTLWAGNVPTSVLDIGCGSGTWMRAAQSLGTSDVFGIDGVDLTQSALHVPKELIRTADLNKPIQLGRQFDLVISMETAEHLEPESSGNLIQSLVDHGSTVLFSAGVPGQGGTHHVNCHWPSYWQNLFNDHGFICDDWIRWAVWKDNLIEPWYRQNAFVARKGEGAGSEPRIKGIIHPDMLPTFSHVFYDEHLRSIESGALSTMWYATTPIKAIRAKLRKRTLHLGARKSLDARSDARNQ